MKEIKLGTRPFIDYEHMNTPVYKRKEFKTIDWKKSKKIIEKEKDKIDYVRAGLTEDWGYTVGTIFMDGKYVEEDENEFETPCYSSFWATPGIKINYKDGTEKVYECFIESNDCNPDIPEWWTK